MTTPPDLISSEKKYQCLRTYKSPTYKSVIETSDGPAEKKDHIIIKVEYSSLNYKDALAVTGKGVILKSFPLVAGIDLAGTILSTGEKVLINGCGLGEVINGGFNQIVQVPKEWIIPLPNNLTTLEAMSLGTAGFTAALSVHRLLENNQTPEKGPIIVTGASGGVGNFAISILKKLGFTIWAITSKKNNHNFLEKIGATKVMTIEELNLGNRPLESVKFAGAIDNLGGDILAGLIRHTELWGNIASVGMALGSEVNSSVFPHILRGVSVLGISSGNCSVPLRKKLWQELSGKLKPATLKQFVSKTIELDEVVSYSEKLLNNELKGRIVVKLSK